jgi:hypothetical protein
VDGRSFRIYRNNERVVGESLFSFFKIYKKKKKKKKKLIGFFGIGQYGELI